MIGKAGYYSVIQYCPDRGREESANVGVLLFVPDDSTIRAKVAEIPVRAKKFFGLDRDQMMRLSGAASSLERLVNYSSADIRTVEDLERFITTRANDIRLTSPRLVKVSHIANDLDELFAELVEEVHKPAEVRVRQSFVSESLALAFHRLLLDGKLLEPGKIKVPRMTRKLDIPFAYKNGVLNLVKPQVFGAGTKSENRAGQLAVEGNLLHKYPDNGERRLIVVSGEDSTPEGEGHACELLNEFNVRFVPQESVEDFAREVEQTAH